MTFSAPLGIDGYGTAFICADAGDAVQVTGNIRVHSGLVTITLEKPSRMISFPLSRVLQIEWGEEPDATD